MSWDSEDFLLDEDSAQAFLADCDLVDGTVTIPPILTLPSCDAEVTRSDSSGSCTLTEKLVEKKKLWHQRRKEEIVNLREEVKQLSAELEMLKLATRVLGTLPSSNKATAAVTTSVVPTPQVLHNTQTVSIWKTIARQQVMLRQISEGDNASLRENLRHRLQQAKSLQRALKRKFRNVMVSPEMNLVKQYQFDARGTSPPIEQ